MQLLVDGGAHLFKLCRVRGVQVVEALLHCFAQPLSVLQAGVAKFGEPGVQSGLRVQLVTCVLRDETAQALRETVQLALHGRAQSLRGALVIGSEAIQAGGQSGSERRDCMGDLGAQRGAGGTVCLSRSMRLGGGVGSHLRQSFPQVTVERVGPGVDPRHLIGKLEHARVRHQRYGSAPCQQDEQGDQDQRLKQDDSQEHLRFSFAQSIADRHSIARIYSAKKWKSRDAKAEVVSPGIRLARQTCVPHPGGVVLLKFFRMNKLQKRSLLKYSYYCT